MSSEKFFCPNCGASVTPEDKFCQNCGAKLKDQEPSVIAPGVQQPHVQTSGPVIPAYQPPPQQPHQAYQPYQPVVQQAGFVDPAHYLQLKADLGSRCLAFLIDSIIWGIISSCTGGFAVFVAIFKDSIPKEGRSFGKQAMNIKVVDYNTGGPMSVPLCTSDGRRVGDYIAGTIVIEDR